MIHLMPTLRLYMPSSLKNMFWHFAPYNAMNLGFGLWQYNVVGGSNFVENGSPLNYNFDKMGFPTNGWFLNISDIFMVVTYTAFVHPVMSLARLVFPKNTYLKNLDRILKDNYLVWGIYLTMFKLCYCSMLTFNTFNIDSPTEMANALCAMFYLFALLMFTLFLAISQYIYWWEM